MKPVISIIIGTYNASDKFLPYALKGIDNQISSKENFEVIFANIGDNPKIRELAKTVDARIVQIEGNPPKFQEQKNAAIMSAKGEYILIVDHDEEMSPNLIGNFINTIKKDKNSDIDAWIVPFKLIEKGRLFSKIRNFEEGFYKDSVVAAARIIRRKLFVANKIHFDPLLNSGPGDWDMDLQLKKAGAKFAYLDNILIYHHEERLGFWGYVNKKKVYAFGGEIYKDKWREKDKFLYDKVVKKQYDPVYRLFGIFIEKGKWKKLILGIHLYIMFLFVKGTMSLIYFHYLLTQKLKHLFLR